MLRPKALREAQSGGEGRESRRMPHAWKIASREPVCPQQHIMSPFHALTTFWAQTRWGTSRPKHALPCWLEKGEDTTKKWISKEHNFRVMRTLENLQHGSV